MKFFEKLLLVAALALATYASYTLIIGFLSDTLCYQSHCAHRDTEEKRFFGYAFLYCLFIVFGFASAWRSSKNIRTVWVGKKPSDTKS